MKVTAFNNLNHPIELLPGPNHKQTPIAPIGPDPFQTRTPAAQPAQHVFATGMVLNVRGVNDHRNNQAKRVDQNMTFTSLYLLPRVVATVPPFRLLTLWLSRMAALGVGLRPFLRRTRS